MIGTKPVALAKLLLFVAVVEIATGLALLADPGLVIALLLGASGSPEATAIGRFLGIALLALGLACRPIMQRASDTAPAIQAMLLYNLLVALYLACLGTIGHSGGLLLWPAVALHAVVALLLIWAWRTNQQAGGAC